MTVARGRFAEQSVLVTGGALGIGRAVVQAFAAEGAHVVVMDVDADALGAAGDGVERVGGDVRRREDVRGAVELAVDRFGRLDVAVQVAGIAEFVPFLEFEDDLWNRILDVNLRGTYHLVQEAARAMVRDGVAGAIAVTSSTNAFQPEAGGLAYNTSKSAQVAVMRTAAMELAPHGIRVNAIAPGVTNTRLSTFVIDDPSQSQVFLDRIPMRRFGEPEDMARPILWMCSQDAAYLSGALVVVDGAMSVGLPDPGGDPVPGDAGMGV